MSAPATTEEAEGKSEGWWTGETQSARIGHLVHRLGFEVLAPLTPRREYTARQRLPSNRGAVIA